MALSSNSFFTSVSKLPITDDNVRFFLENYPNDEYWRFFVECDRYQFGKYLKKKLVDILKNPNLLVNFKDKAVLFSELNKSDQESVLDNMPISYLYVLANRFNLPKLKFVFTNFLKISKQEKISINEYLKKQVAWMGFEMIEPGYLSGMMQGFALIIRWLAANEELTVQNICLLHEVCTSGVKNMLSSSKPGKLRTQAGAWKLNANSDTKNGLKENLEYALTLEKEGKSKLTFSIEIGNKVLFTYSGGEQNIHENLYNIIVKTNPRMKEAKVGIEISETNADCQQATLQQILEKLLVKLEQDLVKAKDKIEKLTAIFTFIKYTVLHHPFQDGVGRTLSMTLLQYLLLRANLLPVIMHDSNFIPGYSVVELVDHYLQAEKKMLMALQTKNFLSSDEFCENNISTKEFQGKLTESERKYLSQCALFVEDEVKAYLAKNNQSKKLELQKL